MVAVCSFFPYPVNHGDAVRRSLLLESLQDNSELTVLSVRRKSTKDQDILEAQRKLSRASLEVFDSTIPAKTSLTARIRRVAISVCRRTPSGMYSEWSMSLERRLRQLAEASDVVIYIGEPSLTHTLPRTSKTPIVVDKSNVLVASRIDALRTYTRIAPRVKALIHLPLTYALERRSVKSAREVWVTSPEEQRRLSRLYQRDSKILRSVAPEPVRRAVVDPQGDLVWMSTFSYEPNWDGLVQLIKSLDTDSITGTRLRVIGAHATPDQVAFLGRFSFVDYLGFQEDLVAACDGARAALIPIWSGAGVKLKTLTFMQMGIPIIATPVAMEGIPHELAAVIAETADDFAAAVRRLSPIQLDLASKKASAYVSSELSPAQFAANLSTLVHQWEDLARPTTP